MSSNYISIENFSGTDDTVVKQNLKFKTGKFVWQVKFSAPLNPATVNNMNLYVTKMDGSPLRTSIRYDAVNQSIEVEPLEPYAQEQSYLLYISKNVESKGGQRLKSDISLRFKL
ncbi:MAG: hypothetical protein E7256_03335 [Lachnospiraceae bacterium]|nr:hypothetical protein [Lachnospiraceae bacterium]